VSAWRLIDSGPGGAFHNMALDEAIAAGVREGRSPPTLRYFGWDRPSVSIGSMQRVEEVDLARCASMDIPVVRRPTGGRGILHGDELTYSLSAPAGAGARGIFSGGLFGSYRKISEAFSDAFGRLGLTPETTLRRRAARRGGPLCFQSASYGEMTVRGMKVIGSAQRRWPGGLLQQGSIPYRLDYEGMGLLFRGGEEAAHGSMAGLGEFLPGLEAGALKEAVKASFQEAFGVRFLESSPTPEEEALAGELLHVKYLRPEWTLRR
jgi:lipoate-protein ligase A